MRPSKGILLTWLVIPLTAAVAVNGHIVDSPGEKPASSRTITVAAEPDLPPFSLVNDNGEPSGFSVELIKAAAGAAGLKVRMRIGIWEIIKKNLADGGIDALPLVGRTPEREASFDLTMPYLSLQGAVFVRGETRGILSIDDLKGKEILVMKGDNAEDFLRREAVTDRIVTTHTFEEAFRILANGRYDAVVTQRIMGQHLLRRMGINSIRALALPLPGFRLDYCFAVQKGDRALLNQLNEGLSVIIADNTYEKIRRRWFGPEFEFKTNLKRTLRSLLLILFPILALFAIIAILILRREVRRRTGELLRLKNQLELKVNQRTEDLHQKIRKLDRSKQAMLYMVEDLNATTKKLIQERLKLKESNRELEAFSYSVSHDLRAPLRAIDGFSQFLEEDYAEKLDNEGKRFITTIRRNANRMDHLIRDLLNLSRTARKEMHFAMVDMQALVRSMFHEIATDEEKGTFHITIEAMPRVRCDPNLIKQVWLNLIGNALKYSSRSKTKKIIIQASRNEKDIVFSIRDFGRGFDHRYTDKLFGVFQRLHGDDEFPGTGVGLAIVQRIVQRHGGRIWAEGKIDSGATFHFTLPSGKEEEN